MAAPTVPSPFLLRAMRSLIISPTSTRTLLLPTRQAFSRVAPAISTTTAAITAPSATTSGCTRSFTTSPALPATLNQIRRSPRKPKKARRPESPAMRNRPEMKGVCLKVGITKPKKPNSGQRKTAKIRLSSGRIVAAYIPGEGHNGGVPNRVRSRSKYGTKKPKAASAS
ncbi:hypothetical protein DV736_g5060, partial [Chaetothyriales sp. CBS 134916]